jgi:hypothetical protein
MKRGNFIGTQLGLESLSSTISEFVNASKFVFLVPSVEERIAAMLALKMF